MISTGAYHVFDILDRQLDEVVSPPPILIAPELKQDVGGTNVYLDSILATSINPENICNVSSIYANKVMKGIDEHGKEITASVAHLHIKNADLVNGKVVTFDRDEGHVNNHSSFGTYGGHPFYGNYVIGTTSHPGYSLYRLGNLPWGDKQKQKADGSRKRRNLLHVIVNIDNVNKIGGINVRQIRNDNILENPDVALEHIIFTVPCANGMIDGIFRWECYIGQYKLCFHLCIVLSELHKIPEVYYESDSFIRLLEYDIKSIDEMVPYNILDIIGGIACGVLPPTPYPGLYLIPAGGWEPVNIYGSHLKSLFDSKIRGKLMAGINCCLPRVFTGIVMKYLTRRPIPICPTL